VPHKSGQTGREGLRGSLIEILPRNYENSKRVGGMLKEKTPKSGPKDLPSTPNPHLSEEEIQGSLRMHNA